MARTGDLGKFLDDVLGTWSDKKVFVAAFECAQTASLYIDIAARQKFTSGKGQLAGSFDPVPAVMSGTTLTAGAYSPLPYAGIREEGGTIKPIPPRKALAVPLTKKAINTGSPLKWSSGKKLIYIPPKKGASSEAAGVFATIKGKVPTRNKKRGRRRKGSTPKKKPQYEAQYMLRYSVTQRGSGYIEQAANQAAPEMEQIIGDAVMHVFASTHIYEVT